MSLTAFQNKKMNKMIFTSYFLGLIY